jgi:hypothetical protein
LDHLETQYSKDKIRLKAQFQWWNPQQKAHKNPMYSVIIIGSPRNSICLQIMYLKTDFVLVVIENYTSSCLTKGSQTLISLVVCHDGALQCKCFS